MFPTELSFLLFEKIIPPHSPCVYVVCMSLCMYVHVVPAEARRGHLIHGTRGSDGYEPPEVDTVRGADTLIG